jgi:hypothetical protein
MPVQPRIVPIVVPPQSVYVPVFINSPRLRVNGWVTRAYRHGHATSSPLMRVQTVDGEGQMRIEPDAFTQPVHAHCYADIIVDRGRTVALPTQLQEGWCVNIESLDEGEETAPADSTAFRMRLLVQYASELQEQVDAMQRELEHWSKVTLVPLGPAQ